MPGVSIALVEDEDDGSVSGQASELLIRSPYLALGHWQNGRLQENIRDADLSFRSGDLVRFREDGLAELVGRKTRWFKLRGQRVDPIEIEGIARSRHDVADAAVVARRENGEVTGLDIFVVPRDPKTPPSIEDIKRTMKRCLPNYMLPSGIHIIDEIPLLSGFKPNLAALSEFAGDAGPQINWGSTHLQNSPGQTSGDDRVTRAVEESWAKVLGQRSAKTNQTWEASGGDSLKALTLLLLIEEALGVRVPLDVLHESVTPKQLTLLRCSGFSPHPPRAVALAGRIAGGAWRPAEIRYCGIFGGGGPCQRWSRLRGNRQRGRCTNLRRHVERPADKSRRLFIRRIRRLGSSETVA
jgi:acyl carrier protein